MKKVRVFSIVIALITAMFCIYALCGCRKNGKYPDALKVGSTEIPRTLMPYVSAHTSNTFVASLVYDTLLGSVSNPVDSVLPDGSMSEEATEDNYFGFTDNLLGKEGAYPRKEGSNYGWIAFNPSEEQYEAQLVRKNIKKGFDEAGNTIEETDEQFAARSENAVPSANWMEYRFKVKEGFTWNDGEQFSASDIVFTFKYVLKNEGALASIAYFLTSYYDCYVDDGDFVLILATNKISDIRTICSSILILPEHIWQNIRKPAQEKNLSPVGTGAYKVVDGDYIADSSLTLTFRDDYDEQLKKEQYGDNPVQHITLICLESEDVMLNSLQKGDIDTSLDDLSSGKAYAVERNSRYGGVEIAAYDSRFVTTLAFNVGKYGAFNDSKLNNSVLVRRAISLAIDQQMLIDDVLYGKGTTVGNGLVQRNHPHALTDDNGTYIDHLTDTDLANSLLDQAGYPKNSNGMRGLSFKILASTANETLVKDIGERLKSTIGISIEFAQAKSDYSEVIKQSNGASFDMIINTVSFSIDQLLMFDARFGSYSNGSARVWNVTGVKDELLTSLMYSMDTETDIFKQYEKAKAVQERVAELCVEVPLFCAKNYSCYSNKNFTGWVAMKDGSVLNAYSLRYLQHK